jgi:hypothetical protein
MTAKKASLGRDEHAANERNGDSSGGMKRKASFDLTDPSHVKHARLSTSPVRTRTGTSSRSKPQNVLYFCKEPGCIRSVQKRPFTSLTRYNSHLIAHEEGYQFCYHPSCKAKARPKAYFGKKLLKRHIKGIHTEVDISRRRRERHHRGYISVIVCKSMRSHAVRRTAAKSRLTNTFHTWGDRNLRYGHVLRGIYLKAD